MDSDTVMPPRLSIAEATHRLRVSLDELDPESRILDRPAVCARFAESSSPDPPGRSAAVSAETIRRFVRDREEIVSTLMHHADPGRLVAIEPAAGDPHQGGRRVVFLRFSDRSDPLVYKPRPVTSAAFYARLVSWLNERLPRLGLAAMPTVSKGGYGWAAFIRPTACRTREDVERFYHRQGALLALLHAANGIDAHADNIIAQGDQPVLIDTETLLHPVLAHPSLAAGDPALGALEQSVLQTLLLPTLMHGAQGTADVSGLGGHGDLTPAKAATRDERSFLPPPNKPILDGKPLDASGHIPALLRGFTDAYTAISRNADAFIEFLEIHGDATMRLVTRPTQVYADLLAESAAQETNSAFAAQELFERKLAQTPAFDGAERLLEHEYRDLSNRDIPIFFTRPASRSIWSSEGVRMDEALQESGLEATRAKVRAMSETDRRRQEWAIDAAFASGTGPISHRCAAPVRLPERQAGPVTPLDPQWALDRSVEIARHLGELAYRGHHRINWLSLEPLEDGGWRILPAGAGLPHGYTGVAVFLAQLGALTGRQEFLERAASAIASLPELLDALAQRPAHLAAVGGGFEGMGGIAYALDRLAALLDAPDLAKLAMSTAELAALADSSDAEQGRNTASGHADADRSDDGWCRGAAGAAAEGRLDPAMLETWLTRLADTPPVSDLSLCHGELGILEALTVLAARDALARAALERRRSMLPLALAHGARLNGTPGSVPTPGLMHGLAGTGYGLLRAGFAEAVPSVLLMQPDGAARGERIPRAAPPRLSA